MKQWLLDEMLASRICYTRERLIGLFRGRPYLTLVEILAETGVEPVDRLWCVWLSDLMPEQLRVFVERAIERHPTHDMRRWTRHTISNAMASAVSRQAIEGLDLIATTAELNSQIADIVDVLTNGH